MIFVLNFHKSLHIMYKCVLNSAVKILLMFAQYFDYYAIILWGVFPWTRCILEFENSLFSISTRQQRTYGTSAVRVSIKERSF